MEAGMQGTGRRSDSLHFPSRETMLNFQKTEEIHI